MTSTVIHQKASPRTTAYRLTLIGTIRSELIKLTSLRSTRWSVIISMILGVGISIVLALAMRADATPNELSIHGGGFLMALTGQAAEYVVIVFGVLGALAFASEYSSGMILSSLTAVPRRGTFFAAKFIAMAVIATIAGTMIVALETLAGVIIAPAVASSIGNSEVLASFAGTIIYVAIMALLSLALAGLLRSTAGAITVFMGILFIIPAVLSVLLQITDWTWVASVFNYVPSQLGIVLAGGIEGEDVPSFWEALLCLTAWMAVPMSLAVQRFFSRDAQ
ncbi:MAG: ABC transporter permease [Arachnia sp.]